MAAYIRHAARYTAGAKAQNIARMFNEVKIVEERHYRLVPTSDLDEDAIRNYRE